jgi:hypothetical protein
MKSKSNLYYDRQSVGQSFLVPGTHLGPATNFSFSLKFYLGSCVLWYFVAPSLTRGRVCNLLLLLVLASSVPLGSESHGTQDYILLSQFSRLHQPGEPGPRIYISQEQSGPVIPPGTGFPFCRFLRLAGLLWSYSQMGKCIYRCTRTKKDWIPCGCIVVKALCCKPEDRGFDTRWGDF